MLALRVTEGDSLRVTRGAPPPLNKQERRLQRGRLRGATRRALLPGRLSPGAERYFADRGKRLSISYRVNPRTLRICPLEERKS